MMKIPVGHTRFSWVEGIDVDENLLLGHSKFSWTECASYGLVWFLPTNMDEFERYRYECATILKEEWPMKDLNARMKQLGDGRSFGLIDRIADKCIGHARIQEANEMGEGMACAAVSVVVDRQFRGAGCGRIMMTKLESICAKDLGYTYIYLWTSTAQAFYEKLGYRVCERINLAQPILRKLDEGKIMTLEKMLSSKLTKMDSKRNDDFGAQHDSPSGENVVWLRKRLVESVPAVTLDMNQLIQAMYQDFTHIFTLPVKKWHKQVGPSCGLAALRMTFEFYFEKPCPPLLQRAIECGFTNDGEIFNIDHLAELGNGIELVCSVAPVDDGTAIRKHIEAGHMVIFPYDRSPGTNEPTLADGSHAHYCVFIGTAKMRDEDFFLAQHGMSKYLLHAPCHVWIASNQQLEGRDAHHKLEYLVHDIKLANKCLVVKTQ